MQEILKKIYSFKFTLIYSAGFYYLGGLVLGLPALAGGILIDRIMNKGRQTRDACSFYCPTLKHWVIYFGLVGVLYPMIIFSAIDPDTSSGLIYNWIEVTQPFTDAMASYVPVIDIYAEQIANFGDDWRVPKFRHLSTVFWFTNIIAAPLLCACLLDVIYAYNLKKIVFNFERFENGSASFKTFNLGALFLLFIAGALLFIVSYLYFGGELRIKDYRKWRDLALPFLFFSLVPWCVWFLMCVVAQNLQYLKYKRNKNV